MSAPTSPSSPRLPGIIAGRYQPVRELGRGGMGAVYEAVHTWTGRRVALKTLLPHLAGDAGAVERFRREARAGVQGAHPHIVEVLDMGVDPEDGTTYLAQELLTGEDLAALLARAAPLGLQRAYELLVPVMAALDAAHRAGVVHRDVKPGNVFLARGAGGAVVPKVIDFGIAALADVAPVTRTGAPIGTPQYMAPEQARGVRDVDARADVWAVGCLWFESLSGARPVAGDNYQALIAALLTAPAPSLRAVAPALPTEVCAAVEGALQPDRARRHRDMATFARLLLAAPCCAGEPWGKALAAAYPFPLASEPARVDPLTLAPTTLQLPPDTAAPPRAETPSPTHTTAPTTRASDTPPRAPTPWRAVALVSIGLALASTAALALRGAPRGAASLAALPPSAPPRVVLPVTPVAAPSAPPPTPPVIAPVPPPTLVRPHGAGAPIASALSVRRPARPRASDAGAARATVINGAPVLEP
jgi:serine/threonine protein kinase